MTENIFSIGTKISRLPQETSLQEKDILIFSKHEEEDKYSSSNGILYSDVSSQFYNNFTENILNDDVFQEKQYNKFTSEMMSDNNFLNTLFQNLSGMMLSNEYFINKLAEELSGKIKPVGTLTYHSNYPSI